MSAAPKPISIHQRTYSTEAFDNGDGTIRVVGRLVDTKPHGIALADGQPLVIHDMEIALTVAGTNFEIQAVDAAMHVHPYAECPAVLSAYDQLVGVSIARGYSRKIKELFGGSDGCSHVGALLIALGPVAIQASWGLNNLHAPIVAADTEPVDAEHLDFQLRMNANTCHIWSTEGEQVAMLRRGERPRRPLWQTDRINEVLAREAVTDSSPADLG